MSGEEAAGPPGPKALRLLYFVGAGCNQFLIFPFILHIIIHILRSNEIAVICVFDEIVFTFSHMHGCNQQVARAGAKGSPKERAAIASNSKFS